MVTTLAHYAWHREEDGWSFWVALDDLGNVISAYAASERVAPGTLIEWEACAAVEQMTLDMQAGGWHFMGGEPVHWECSWFGGIQ